MARGIALIVAAVLLGVILLNATDEPGATPVSTQTTTPDGKPSTNTTITTVPGTTPTTVAVAHNPAEVTVLVANGAGIDGLASKIADTLKGANYVLAQPGNTKAPAETSSVYFTPGYEADAAAVSALLNPHPAVAAIPDPVPVEDMKGANILVVAAADLDAAAG
jgi:succinyl-CoA synthetase alpha subunit